MNLLIIQSTNKLFSLTTNYLHIQQINYFHATNRIFIQPRTMFIQPTFYIKQIIYILNVSNNYLVFEIRYFSHNIPRYLPDHLFNIRYIVFI